VIVLPLKVAGARILRRHRSTVGREVRRNRAHSDGTYRPPLADWYARGRRSRSRRNRRFAAADWERVQELVREDWSPEQVAGWLRRHQELAISHEMIYRHIWDDKRQRLAAKLNRRPRKRLATTPRRNAMSHDSQCCTSKLTSDGYIERL